MDLARIRDAKLPWAEPPEPIQHRICSVAHADKEPCFRASGLGRFNDPDARFETIYAASSFRTCFFEVVVRDRGPEIPESLLAKYALVDLILETSALRLVKLHGAETLRFGLNAATLLEANYADTGRVAQALHEHREQPHGIVYRSRFDSDHLALVLFGRARPHVRLKPRSSVIPLLELMEANRDACSLAGVSLV